LNIFVAGVHGVGKSHLASQASRTLALVHTSASRLINEERKASNWSPDKKVSDANTNQIALAAAVKRYNSAGERLLLDGHFVLLGSEGEFVRLGPDVFRPLSLDGVILIEAAPDLIAARIRERDGREVEVEQITKFMAAERVQAQMVCDELAISLFVLNSPGGETFAGVVAAIAEKAGWHPSGPRPY
jgi:adenylate kinase